ncbi:MAG: hypothetical protein WBD75_08060 [Phycisphaerae bacterium]
MIYLLIVLLILTMILRPLRRIFFAWPTFFIPAAAGAVVAAAVGEYVMVKACVPWPLSFLIPGAMAAGAAIGLGGSCVAWCAQTFSGRDQRRGGNGT